MSDDDLVARTKALKAKAKAKPEASETATPAVPAKVEAAPAISSKLWPEGMRGLPNEILRSALFNARNHKTERAYMDKVEIASIGNAVITYTGKELRQDDELVWMELIHLAKGIPAGQPIEFSPHSFLVTIGWDASGKSYLRLAETLNRMRATSLVIKSNRLKRERGLMLGLVDRAEWLKEDSDEYLTNWKVTIAPELVELFAGGHFSRIDLEQRLALPDGLATWLQGYFATHKAPYALKLETIKEAAGLVVKKKSHLKGTVEKALENLVAVGFLESWIIEEDLVEVARKF